MWFPLYVHDNHKVMFGSIECVECFQKPPIQIIRCNLEKKTTFNLLIFVVMKYVCFEYDTMQIEIIFIDNALI